MEYQTRQLKVEILVNFLKMIALLLKLRKSLPPDYLMYLSLGVAAFLYCLLDNETYFLFLKECKRYFNLKEDKDVEILAFWSQFFVSVALYWLYAVVMIFLESVNFTKLKIARFKIQRTKYSTPQQIRKACKVVAINQFIVNIPLGYLFYRGMLWRKVSIWDPLPSLSTVFLQLVGFLIIEEIGNAQKIS